MGDDFHAGLASSDTLETARALLRGEVPMLDEDRHFHPDMEAAIDLVGPEPCDGEPLWDGEPPWDGDCWGDCEVLGEPPGELSQIQPVCDHWRQQRRNRDG